MIMGSIFFSNSTLSATAIITVCIFGGWMLSNRQSNLLMYVSSNYCEQAIQRFIAASCTMYLVIMQCVH